MNDSYLHIGIYIAYSRCAKRRTIIAICIQHIFLALMLIARSRLRIKKTPFRMRLCTTKRVLRNGNCELIENYLGHIQIFLGILYYLFVCVIFFSSFSYVHIAIIISIANGLTFFQLFFIVGTAVVFVFILFFSFLR